MLMSVLQCNYFNQDHLVFINQSHLHLKTKDPDYDHGQLIKFRCDLIG